MRYIFEIISIIYDGVIVEVFKVVFWYFDDFVWMMIIFKNVVCKFFFFVKFQCFLVFEISVGNISRQEVVFMIFFLFMDFKFGMIVFDFCVVFGSKVVQFFEMIYCGEEFCICQVISGFFGDVNGVVKFEDKQEDEVVRFEVDFSDDGRVIGMFIVNDVDYKCSYMFIYQFKCFLLFNMIVINYDVIMYFVFRIFNFENLIKFNYFKFDCIFVDVFCFGDGIFCKNVNFWKDWIFGSVLGFYFIQVCIFVCVLQMFKLGGWVVYLICFMNFVENEFVVVVVIERCGGFDKIEIFDCSNEFFGFQCKFGMRKWQIMDKFECLWNIWQEVEEYIKFIEDGVIFSCFVEFMFFFVEGSDCVDFFFDCCMCVYFYQQDIGGFFIIVFYKKVEFKVKFEENRKQFFVVRINGQFSGVIKRFLEEEDEEKDDFSVKKFKVEEEIVQDEIILVEEFFVFVLEFVFEVVVEVVVVEEFKEVEFEVIKIEEVFEDEVKVEEQFFELIIFVVVIFVIIIEVVFDCKVR